MTIRTNFTNLKGNTIRLVSATEGSGAGDDTAVIIGEYISGTTDLFQAPAGTCTIDGNDTTTTENQCLDLSGTWVVAGDGSVLDATRTFNVQGGKRGVKFFSGSSVPISVAGSQIGDLYLDTSITEPNRSKLYEKMTQSNPGLATDWQERADLTGAQGFSISASATSNTGLGESNTLTISNTDSAVADVDISINSGTTGSAGAGFATYADNTLYPIGSTVIFNNTQWRALVEVPVTNTDDPVEGDDWSEISTLSQDQFVTSIDDLSDVDTTTDAPSDGDTLVWSTDKWIPGTPEGGGGLFGEFELARTPLTLTLTFTGTTFNEHRITHPSNTLPAYFNQVSGITLGVGFSFIFGWEDNAGVPLQGNGFGASANGLWIQGGTDSAITDYVDDLITNINAISTDAAGTEGTLNVGANRITIQRLCVATRGAGNSVVLTQLDDTFVADPVTTSDFSNGITEVFAQSASVIADKTYSIRSPILHLSEAYVCIEGYDATSTSLLPAADTTHWKSLT